MKILIIDDEEVLRSALEQMLTAECFAVDSAPDGDKGSFLARTNDYDLAIIDYKMPGKDGLKVCEEIRAAGKTVPVLFLSVENDPLKKADLLNAGADDYLTKPFSAPELMARVRALLRRPKDMAPDVLKFDDLTVDVNSQKVRRGKQEVYLTRKEFMLLEFLLRNQGKVVSRSMLIEHVWDSDLDPFSNTIESHILSLRKKVDKKQRKLIQTVPGRGYKIADSR